MNTRAFLQQTLASLSDKESEAPYDGFGYWLQGTRSLVDVAKKKYVVSEKVPLMDEKLLQPIAQILSQTMTTLPDSTPYHVRMGLFFVALHQWCISKPDWKDDLVAHVTKELDRTALAAYARLAPGDWHIVWRPCYSSPCALDGDYCSGRIISSRLLLSSALKALRKKKSINSR